MGPGGRERHQQLSVLTAVGLDRRKRLIPFGVRDELLRASIAN